MLSRLWKSEPTEAERYAEASRRRDIRSRERTPVGPRRTEPGVASTNDRAAGRATTASVRTTKPRSDAPAFAKRDDTAQRRETVADRKRPIDPREDPFLRNSAERPETPPNSSYASRKPERPFAPQADPRPEKEYRKVAEPVKAENPFAVLNRAARRATSPTESRPAQSERDRRDPFYREDTVRKPAFDGKVATVPSLDDEAERARLAGRSQPRTPVAKQEPTAPASPFDAVQSVSSSSSPANRLRKSDSNAMRATFDRNPQAMRSPVFKRSSMPIISDSGREVNAPAAPDARTIGLSRRGGTGSESNPFARGAFDRTGTVPPVKSASPAIDGSSRDLSRLHNHSRRKVLPGDRSMIVDSHLVPDRFADQSVPSNSDMPFVEPGPKKSLELKIVPRTSVKPKRETTSIDPVIKQASAVRVSAMQGRFLSTNNGWVAKKPPQPQTPTNSPAVDATPVDQPAPPPAELPLPEQAAAIGEPDQTAPAPPESSAAESATADADLQNEDEATDGKPAKVGRSSQILLLAMVCIVTLAGYFLRRRQSAQHKL